MTKTEITDLAGNHLVKLETRRPTFGLFRRAYEGFIRALDEVNLDAIGGAEVMMMNGLSQAFAEQPGENPLWGRIFVSLFFCSNFSRQLWERLTAFDRNNAIFAAEHCFDVIALSGATGSPALVDLLNKLELWEIVDRKFTDISALSVWGEQWAIGMRSRRQI